MNTNYDKELLLDFIEWLEEKQTTLVMYAEYEDAIYLDVKGRRLINMIDQYLEDDE